MNALSVAGLLRKRRNDGNKYDFGYLFCVCGSANYRGAAALAVKSALRSGVGLCCLASTEKVVSSAASKTDECTFLPLEENANGAISCDSLQKILEKSRRATAMLLGPGLTLDDGAVKLVYGIIEGADAPLVLDADALNAVSIDRSVLSKHKKSAVLTPHFGEMARLCKTSVAQISESPEKYASEFSAKYNCTVVLKSHITYIASPEGEAFTYGRPNSGLAKGGSGDVLSGLIASLLAQGYPPPDAARLGVFIHSEAGRILEERLGGHSLLPSDIPAVFPEVFRSLEKGRYAALEKKE